MDRAETYRKNADEAERHAQLSADEVERAAYRRIAEGWRDLEQNELRRLNRGV
jgi:hypothetical protein